MRIPMAALGFPLHVPPQRKVGTLRVCSTRTRMAARGTQMRVKPQRMENTWSACSTCTLTGACKSCTMSCRDRRREENNRKACATSPAPSSNSLSVANFKILFLELTDLCKSFEKVFEREFKKVASEKKFSKKCEL